MIEQYHNKINKRILSGNLPLERLYSVPYSKSSKVDLQGMAKEGIHELLTHQEVLARRLKYEADFESLLLDSQGDDYDEAEKEFYKTNISLVLNTGYSQSALPENSVIHKRASELCPYVTSLDKRLWKMAVYCELATKLSFEDDTSMPYAYAYMLLVVQEKELSSGYTIDLDKIDLSTQIMTIILEPWGDDHSIFLTEISQEERDHLLLLKKERNELSVTAENEQLKTEKLARETDRDWCLFLELVYELSNREEQTIERIADKSLSAEEKLEAIRLYEDAALDMRCGFVTIGGKHENLYRIINSVSKRFDGAPELTLVEDQEGQIFGLNREIVKIIERNASFNRIQIKYFQFRLVSRSAGLAQELFSLLLYGIQRNLGIKNDEVSSQSTIEMLVNSFYEAVDNFYNQHEETIKNLRFSNIQSDAVAASDNVADNLFLTSAQEKMLSFGETFAAELQAKNEEYLPILGIDESYCLNEENLQDLLSSIPNETLQELTNGLSSLLETPKQFVEELFPSEKEQVAARQFVTSLNVVFLFNDTLRIVLEEPNRYSLEDKDGIIRMKTILRILKSREGLIKSMVYSEIDLADLSVEDMDTHRERIGIDAQFLSKLEKDCANINLLDAFNDEVKRWFLLADERNIEELLEAKLHLHETLFIVDDSKGAEPFIAKLDEISEWLCALLVKACQQKGKTFEETKIVLRNSLGHESILLPASAMNALVTAEMLYQEYANEKFAIPGFDYSGISALYYQAFEAAYNELIWRDYESELNNLCRNGEKYTEILVESRNERISVDAFIGYLAQDSGIRKNYIDYDKKAGRAQVKKSIMYKNFAEILKYSILLTKHDLKKFCGYFAHLVGFANSISMINDSYFMSNITDFVSAIEKAADNRNNASHGGKIIDINQLNADKKTVLSNLEEVRSDSLGLIQKLLFLMSYHTHKKTGT